MKSRFNETIKKIKRNSVEVIEKVKTSTVDLIDQNDNGELDLNDIKEIVNKTSLSTKEKIKNFQSELSRKNYVEKTKSLNPVFIEDIDESFEYPILINLTDKDKKHKESDICENSFGHFSKVKEHQYLNIYLNEGLQKLNIKFYPQVQKGTYIVDPTNKQKYIEVDKYFNYLKEARIFELQKIAQDLGAKSFKITYVEDEKSSTISNKKINLGIKNMKARADMKSNTFEKAKFTIAAESKFPGHSPIQPELKYLANEESIHSLITLRMNPQSALSYQKLILEFHNSSGLTTSQAVEIDVVLHNIKGSGGMNMQSELQNESLRRFEYEIEF